MYTNYGICAHREMYQNVPSSTLCDTKKLGNKVSILYMENVLQLYNGILNTEKIN